jgi:hypothetical protein
MSNVEISIICISRLLKELDYRNRLNDESEVSVSQEGTFGIDRIWNALCLSVYIYI